MPGGHPHSRLTAQCRPARLVPSGRGGTSSPYRERSRRRELTRRGLAHPPRCRCNQGGCSRSTRRWRFLSGCAGSGRIGKPTTVMHTSTPSSHRCGFATMLTSTPGSAAAARPSRPSWKLSPNRILAPDPLSRVGKIRRDTFRSSRGPGRPPFAQLRAGSPNSIRLCLRQAYPRRAREPAPPGVSPSRSSGAGWAGSTSPTSTRSCRTDGGRRATRPRNRDRRASEGQTAEV